VEEARLVLFLLFLLSAGQCIAIEADRYPPDLYEAYNWNYVAANDPEYPDASIPEINMWPKDVPGFKDTLCTYQSTMISLARKLTRMFALALHVPEDSFDGAIRRPEAGARIVHYPQQTASRDEQVTLMVILILQKNLTQSSRTVSEPIPMSSTSPSSLQTVRDWRFSASLGSGSRSIPFPAPSLSTLPIVS